MTHVNHQEVIIELSDAAKVRQNILPPLRDLKSRTCLKLLLIKKRREEFIFILFSFSFCCSYANITAEPRTVVLHRGRKGFGFILRGAKATSPLMELTPSDKCPALQYLDDVDPGGVADMAGLRKGDFILEINKEDVSSASHEHVVDLIRKSGDLVSMTVVSLASPTAPGTIPNSKSSGMIPGVNVEVPISRQYSTLPRKLSQSAVGTLGRSNQAPLPPRRDPKTTLSVGRTRAKSMVAGLGKSNNLLIRVVGFL